MTPNEAVVKTVYDAIQGKIRLPERPGFCLQQTRIIIEKAHGLRPHQWYEWMTHKVERNPGDDTDPWARDMERSLSRQGQGVIKPEQNQRHLTPEQLQNAQPGDILFRWDTAKTKSGNFVGHVGILYHGGLVFENINPRFRKQSYMRDVNALTPLMEFPCTLVVRFDPNKKPDLSLIEG